MTPERMGDWLIAVGVPAMGGATWVGVACLIVWQFSRPEPNCTPAVIAVEGRQCVYRPCVASNQQLTCFRASK